MTHDRDIERLLSIWLREGPDEVPDRVLDEVASRIGRQAQRPAWRLTWRDTPVTAYLKPIAALAAVLILAVGGVAILRQPSGTGAPTTAPTSASPVPTQLASPTPSPKPTPSPMPAPSATAAAACSDPAFQCSGVLAAGAHASAIFQPALAFEVPSGWTNTLDRDRAFTLRPPNGVFTFQVLSQVAIPEQDGTCSAVRKEAAGNDVTDWITFLTTHPGLEASAPEPVSVGGHDGMRVQFQVASGWRATCPGSLGPAVVLVTDTGNPPSRVLWVDDQVSSFMILDVAGTTVILRIESAPSIVANDFDVRTAQPVVDSFVFTPAG
jgi:hypothetical protein